MKLCSSSRLAAGPGCRNCQGPPSVIGPQAPRRGAGEIPRVRAAGEVKEKVVRELFKGPYGGLSAQAIFLIIAVGIPLVVLWPLAFIWAVNTLFGLAIPLNFWTWLAAVVFLVTIGGLASAGRSSS